MLSKMIIPVTEEAVNKLLFVENWNLNGSLSLVGSSITQTVNIEIPTVENPDVDTDTDWTLYVYDGEDQVLDLSNNRRSVPFRGLYRISKPASVGNAFGVRYE